MNTRRCLFRSGTLLWLLISAISIQAVAQQRRKQTNRFTPIENVSEYLHNTARPDVGGEGLWMPYLDKKLTGWLKPSLGFVGDVYYVHATNLKGLFAIRLIGDDGKELKPEVVRHDWYPTHTVTQYRAGVIRITETKFITDTEQAVSAIDLHNTGLKSFIFRLEIEDLLPGEVVSQGSPDSLPLKKLTFKPTTHYFRDLTISKYYYLDTSSLKPRDARTLSGEFRIAPKGRLDLYTHLALATEVAEADQRRIEDVPGETRLQSFADWFKRNVPPLRTSDRALEKMYYYRWYLLKKASIHTRHYVPDHPYPYPALYEGQAGTWFPKIIGLPIPLQLLEARWLSDKSIACDQARNALTRDDFFNYLNWTPYAFWQLHLVAPDREFLKEALPKVRNFIRLEELKDEDHDWLPTVFGSWITGMEYQPSFFHFTRPKWDHTVSEEFKPGLDALSRDPSVYHQFTPIERVDEASYYYLNNVAAARIARALGDESVAREYEGRAAKIKQAVDERMWDGRTKFFYDLEPATKEKALEAKVIVGFWPYLFGEMQGSEKLALFDHMLNPGEFWTPFPVATASRDCPAYDPHGYWKVGPKASPEKPFFYEDSWNGPAWIFSNALAAETLGQAARLSRSPRLRRAFNELMRKYTQLQFVNGDLSVPCTVEHYDAETGQPIRFLADYFHSFYNDLVIRYFAGIVPRADDKIEIDPLLEGVDYFEIRDVVYKGHRVSVAISAGGGFSARVDGRRIFHEARPARVIYDPTTGVLSRGSGKRKTAGW